MATNDNTTDLELRRLSEQLARYDLSVVEWREGGFNLYRRAGTWSRHFDTLAGIKDYLRERYPELCRDYARETLSGIGEVVRLLDPDSANDCDNPTAVVIAIRRLCDDGLRELEYLEMLQAEARREASK